MSMNGERGKRQKEERERLRRGGWVREERERYIRGKLEEMNKLLLCPRPIDNLPRFVVPHKIHLPMRQRNKGEGRGKLKEQGEE